MSENHIYIGGEFNVDSGRGEVPWDSLWRYNFGIWDGSSWHLEAIGAGARIFDFHVFNPDDIWATGDIVFHWDGAIWWEYNLRDMGVLTIESIFYVWGSDPQNIWFVGSNGAIVHYNGNSFTKVPSNTGIWLESIDGTPDGRHVFASGYQSYENPDISVLMHWDSESAVWDTLIHEDMHGPDEYLINNIYGVLVMGDHVYTTSQAYYLIDYNFVTNELEITGEGHGRTGLGGARIVGNHPNDMFFLGGGKLLHYYGQKDTYISSPYYEFFLGDIITPRSFSLNGDLIAIGGTDRGGGTAIFALGIRN